MQLTKRSLKSVALTRPAVHVTYSDGRLRGLKLLSGLELVAGLCFLQQLNSRVLSVQTQLVVLVQDALPVRHSLL